MKLIMDPLGVVVDVVPPDSLKTWSQIQPTIFLLDKSKEQQIHTTSPFPYNPAINDRLILWVGDISTLSVDAVVNVTNETMNDRNPVSDRIFARAGPSLLEEIQSEIKECKTGEVRVSQAYNLPARFIIHTVGPKYRVKFQTAAENTLHLCYRNVLQKACEMKLSSIALCVIHSVRKNFPPDQGAHIALRTVRRFLERYGSSLEYVIFAVDATDIGIYQILMPLYFPRSVQEEQMALSQLPPNVGGNDGEPILPDRQIRIIDNPQHSIQEECEELTSSQPDTLVNIGEHAFSQMQGDMDRQRLLGERPLSDPIGDLLVKEMQNKERYERLLRQAKTEDLSEVSGIGCLYQSGVDRLGRPVIVFVGKWFRFKDINLDKALLYLIYLLDPLVKNDYVIMYFHTLTSNANHPSLSWLRDVYSILPYKYKKNLKAFYIVHPTFWTKMMTWWFTTFMAPAIKQKVMSLPGVEYLYAAMTPSQLEIPAFITEYDMTVNGLHYFQPAIATT